MAKIERSIKINAPVEKVFEFISDPTNFLQTHPGLTDVEGVTGRGEGQAWSWRYKMMARSFRGTAQVTRSVLNAERVEKTTGGIISTWTRRLRREDEGTQLVLMIDYTIPIPVLGKVGELLTLRQNEREADLGMANIKDKLEGWPFLGEQKV